MGQLCTLPKLSHCRTLVANASSARATEAHIACTALTATNRFTMQRQAMRQATARGAVAPRLPIAAPRLVVARAAAQQKTAAATQQDEFIEVRDDGLARRAGCAA